MGLLNFFRENEMPTAEPVKLKRVPTEKNDGHWAPKEKGENSNYENEAEMLKKIHEQRAKEYSEIKNHLESLKN